MSGCDVMGEVGWYERKGVEAAACLLHREAKGYFQYLFGGVQVRGCNARVRSAMAKGKNGFKREGCVLFAGHIHQPQRQRANELDLGCNLV